MSKIIRTVRFDKTEITKIEQFLRKNSFLDFSSLTRLALNHFIENPTAQIRPLNEKRSRSQRDAEV